MALLGAAILEWLAGEQVLRNVFDVTRDKRLDAVRVASLHKPMTLEGASQDGFVQLRLGVGKFSGRRTRQREDQPGEDAKRMKVAPLFQIRIRCRRHFWMHAARLLAARTGHKLGRA